MRDIVDILRGDLWNSGTHSPGHCDLMPFRAVFSIAGMGGEGEGLTVRAAGEAACL